MNDDVQAHCPFFFIWCCLYGLKLVTFVKYNILFVYKSLYVWNVVGGRQIKTMYTCIHYPLSLHIILMKYMYLRCVFYWSLCLQRRYFLNCLLAFHSCLFWPVLLTTTPGQVHSFHFVFYSSMQGGSGLSFFFLFPLFPSGVQCLATVGMLYGSLLVKWPVQFQHYLTLILFMFWLKSAFWPGEETLV